jgi:predicted Zn-dependent protease
MFLPLFAIVMLLQGLAATDVIRQVDTAIREHRSDDAIATLGQALKTDPQWRRGWWLLGSVLYDAEKYTAAHSALERLLRIDPKSGQGWAVLGLCEFETRNYGLALEYLQRGDALGIPVALDLTDVVRYHEALLLILDNRFDPAQVLLDQLTRKGLETDEVAMAQGLVALRIPLLPASLRYTANDRIEIIRRVGLAQRAIAHAKLTGAIAIYKDLISRNENIPNLHLSYAALLLQTRDRKASESELRTELKLNPNSVEARLRLCALLENDSPGAALILASEAVALDPASFKAHFFLGKSLFTSEKLAESARELETSRDLNPSSSTVRFALIRTYNALGKRTEAKQEAEVLKRWREMEDRFRASGRVPVSESGP